MVTITEEILNGKLRFLYGENKNESKLDEDIILVVEKKFVEQRHLSNFQKQPHQRWYVKKSVIENFTKFTGKHLCFKTLLKASYTGVFL